MCSCDVYNKMVVLLWAAKDEKAMRTWINKQTNEWWKRMHDGKKNKLMIRNYSELFVNISVHSLFFSYASVYIVARYSISTHCWGKWMSAWVEGFGWCWEERVKPITSDLGLIIDACCDLSPSCLLYRVLCFMTCESLMMAIYCQLIHRIIGVYSPSKVLSLT